MNARVLDLIESYERYSSLYDDEAKYYFELLFNNNDAAPIFCDLMGMPEYLEDITVRKYIDLLMQQSQNTVVTLKDVAKGEYEFRDGKWYVPVAFRKSVSYIDQGGYVFSVEDYFGAEYNMLMQLCYDPVTDNCYACSVKGELKSTKTFPKERFMIVDRSTEIDPKSAKYMESLTVNGMPLEYNQFGQAILAPGEISTYDPDVEITTEKGYEGFNYDVVSFKFNPKNTRIRLRYGYAPFAYSVNNLNNKFTEKSSAMEMGADLGFAFQVGVKSKMSFNFGAALSLSNISLDYSPASPVRYDYSYLSGASNGMLTTGTVAYQINGASEAVKYTDFVVPVYFEVEHNVNKWLMISWDFGVKGYYALGSQVVTPYSLVAMASVNGGAQNNVMLASAADGRPVFVVPNSYAKNTIDLSATANLGADFSLYKRNIYAMLRVGYEYGILNSYQSDQRAFDQLTPVVYDADAGKHVAVNSLFSGQSFKRNALWISFGFKFKL